jgi:hypothetical protein
MKALWILPGISAALLFAVFALDSIWGGGHPSVSAVVLFWGLYPTLTLYLSRALLGVDFPSPALMPLGLLEYALVGVGLALADRQSARAGFSGSTYRDSRTLHLHERAVQRTSPVEPAIGQFAALGQYQPRRLHRCRQPDS